MFRRILDFFSRSTVINISTPNIDNEYTFTIIGSVMIVNIPVGRMPPTKAEQHMHRMAAAINPLKESFGVSNILYLPRSAS